MHCVLRKLLWFSINVKFDQFLTEDFEYLIENLFVICGLKHRESHHYGGL